MCGVVGVIQIDQALNRQYDSEVSLSHGSDQGQQALNTEVFQPEKLPATHAGIDVFHGLLSLQHRGQDAAGILSYEHTLGRFFLERHLGLVNQALEQESIKSLKGQMAIGHTRYATVGGNGTRDLQPMVSSFPFGIGLVHNGNLLNYPSLRKMAKDEFKVQLLSENDLEFILQGLCYYLSQTFEKMDQEYGRQFNFVRLSQSLETLMPLLNGAYACVGLVAGHGMFAFRDPHGIRPLVMGKRVESNGRVSYGFASETSALDFLNFEVVRDVGPSELIYIDINGEVHSKIIGEKEPKAHCMFEYVYFSGAESFLEGRSVYSTRLKLGTELGQQIKSLVKEGLIAPDIVMPVPDTSRTAAISMAQELELPYREGLIKNRYVQRSFILPLQSSRDKAVERKLIPVKSEIEGRKILLVDDSLVRGTTSKKIISLLRKHGAKEVTLALTCPPIRYPCYYGIDFPRENELMAFGKSEEEMAMEIGANRVVFLSQEGLKKAIGMKELCKACLDGKYPTCVTEGKEFALFRDENKGN